MKQILFFLQMKPMLITDEVNVNFIIADANIQFFNCRLVLIFFIADEVDVYFFFITDEINVDFYSRWS